MRLKPLGRIITHEPDIAKLRRFSLTIAILILTYSIAGISFDPHSQVTIMSLPFKAARPDLLPIGLIIASIYATLSFSYYGFMLKKPPWRLRRDLLNGLHASDVPPSDVHKRVPLYFGPTHFYTAFPVEFDAEGIKEYLDHFPETFPKFLGASVSTDVHCHKPTDEERANNDYTFDGRITIPNPCRIAALFQDIDYSSPVWLNILALCIFLFSK